MTSDPEISVIIPTYNRAHSIGKSIASVLSQDFSNFELLIIDDASTDSTKQVINGFNDERIKTIYLKSNAGASNARNVGINSSKGQYIAFLDSDDEWLNNKLSKQYSILKNSQDDIGCVYSSFRRISPEKEEIVPGPEIKCKEGNLFCEVLKQNFITFQTLLAKRKCFKTSGLFDVNLQCRHDWDLIIRLARDWKFLFINEPMVNIYTTKDSISSNSEIDFKGWLPIVEKHIDYFSEHPSILANQYMRIATWSVPINQEEFIKRKNLMLKAIKIHPSVSFKYFILLFPALLGFRTYTCIRKTLKYGKNKRIN